MIARTVDRFLQVTHPLDLACQSESATRDAENSKIQQQKAASCRGEQHAGKRRAGDCQDVRRFCKAVLEAQITPMAPKAAFKLAVTGSRRPPTEIAHAGHKGARQGGFAKRTFQDTESEMRAQKGKTKPRQAKTKHLLLSDSIRARKAICCFWRSVGLGLLLAFNNTCWDRPKHTSKLRPVQSTAKSALPTPAPSTEF